MPKPSGDSFDAKKRFASVPMSQGEVQKDSDWNKGGRRGRLSLRGWLLIVVAVAGVALILGLATTALGMGPIAAALEARRQPPLVVSLVFPEDGATLPLRSTLWVRGEIAGRSTASELTLIVNGQTWDTTALTEFDRGASWGWTPSGEGRHELTVVAHDAAGRTFSSPTASVYASGQADFRFPYQHTLEEGDNLSSLGETYSSSSEEILDANPGLSADGPLAPGDTVTIPVHVPTGPEQAPASGEAAAPPVGPLPETPPGAIPPQSDGTAFGDVVVALNTLPVPPGFTIKNGTLIPSQPVDSIYLYVAIGDDNWERVPKDPHAFIVPIFGVFDLKPYLDFAALDNLTEPVLLKVEGWGWAGSALVSLGSYSGYYGAGQLHWPYGGTDLQVYSHQTLGKKYYTTKAQVSGDASDWSLQFRWSSQTAGVTGGVVQISEKPFPNSLALNPPGLVQYGIDADNPGEFTINLRDYFFSDESNFFEGIGQAIGDAVGDVVGGATGGVSWKGTPAHQYWPFLSRTFFVRVVPLGAGTSAEASNTVVVYFTPSGKPVPITGPLNGPVYEARILGFDPYLPADPAYSTCWVMNVDVQNCKDVLVFSAEGISSQQQCTTSIPKGTWGCGCPGVSCSSSGSSCSLSPSDWGDCISEGAQAVGSWIAKGWDALAGVYNDAVAFVKEMAATLNPFCIQAKIAAAELGGDTVTKEDVEDVCAAVTDIAVTAVMAYFGLPPSLPEFDKLMDEGLDYAIGIAASELGIECNKQCRDLLKEGFQAATSGENLLEKGLDLGASMAADELRDLGYDCDAKCEQLIQDGAQGKASFGQVTDAAIDQATQQIVGQLNANGYSCDQDCADAIRNQLKQGAAIGQIAQEAAASPSYTPFMVPHPRAAESPAIVRVEIFRRWESAEIPNAELERCGLSLDNLVANDVSGQPMSGRLFEPIGVDLPILDPGERMVVPVLLERAGVPLEVMQAMNPSGQHISLPGLGDVTDLAGWFNFYSQGQITLRTWGPLFISTTSNKSLPCIDEVSASFGLPDVGFEVDFP
jgi:Penicillin-Binding Protein C-terminus Family/LysM domain